MASEKDANKAREVHGRDLLRMGAHSLGVERGEAYGKPGWVVVAHLAPGAKADLPATLPLSKANDGDRVPLVIKKSERFVPE